MNIFNQNNNTAGGNQPSNIFGTSGSGTTGGTAPAANIFGNKNSASTGGAPSGGNIFQGNSGTSAAGGATGTGTPTTGIASGSSNPSTSIFGNKSPIAQPTGGTGQTPAATTSNPPSTGIFGQGGTGAPTSVGTNPQPSNTSANIFNNQPSNTSANIFNNQPSNTSANIFNNQTSTGGTGTLGSSSTPAGTSGTTAGTSGTTAGTAGGTQGGIFSNPGKNTQGGTTQGAPTATIPAATTTTTTQGGANIFSGNQPATTSANPPASGASFFSNPQATNTQPTTTQPAATQGTSLFQPSTGTNPAPAATTSTNPQNIFNSQGAATTTQLAGTAGTTGTLPAQSQDNIQAQFDRSNQTVGQFIQQCKSTFLHTYQDLNKVCESTLKFLAQRDDNRTIAKNFQTLEPLISGKSEYVLKTLDHMERQQDDFERAIDMMSKRMGQGRYTHELSEHLQDYESMKDEIVKMQEQGQDWNDPGNQQLINIFQNLNMIQMQITQMNQIVDIYMDKIGYI